MTKEGETLDINAHSEIKSCDRCGKMFLFTGPGKCICPNCKAEDEEQFHTVKQYIFDNPSATLRDVADQTKVKVIRIKNYLRDGRLVIPDGSMVFINCEVCGASIKFGRVCRSCADSLSNDLKAAMEVNEYNIGEKPAQMGSSKRPFLDNK